MHHDSVNEFSYNFRCQFSNIGVHIHNSEKSVGIQHFILLGADFIIQRGCLYGKLLLFSLIPLCQHLKLLSRQIFKGKFLKRFA